MLRYLRKWWWLAAIVLFDIWLYSSWTGCSDHIGETKDGGGCTIRRRALAPESPAILIVGFSTSQTNLWNTNDASVFMPTESGRLQSALYGSTRTRMRDGRAIPSFHEGIDIAPIMRDTAGRARDDVFAIADGLVAYANRTAGASNYGRYVVIEHDVAIGPIYSLYSHLESIPDTLHQGEFIKRGTVVGRMGHSSTMGIPRARSHLHLEVDLMLNERFNRWLKKNKMDTCHGIYHGWNLTGIDPLALYPTTDHEQQFSMLNHLTSLPVAFELILRSDRPLNYFARYAALWKSETSPGGVSVLSISHGGIIVAGRGPTQDELARLGNRNNLVLKVNAEVLNPNGQGLIISTSSGWELTRYGRRWLEILLH